MNVEKRIELAKRRADLNYFIYLNEKAVYEVEAVEKAGRCGALCGLAVAVKDNIEVAGMPITNGAPYMKKMADKTAPVVRRLIAEGAVVIGKTNMHELALGATNVNPHFGPTRNPHDPSRITGGSSGGSAGAVAIGVADLGIGTDTGGSVRIPAALCGVVGYKPPYGKIPTEGVLPLAQSLDHVGFITRTVADLIRILSAAGWGPSELPRPNRFRFAVLMGISENTKHVEKAFWKAVGILESIGGMRDEVFIETGRYAAARAAILLSEAAANYYDYLRGAAEHMGNDVATLLSTGAALPAVAYITAKRVKEEATKFFDTLFKKYDVVVTPTTATEAVPIEEADSIAVRPKLLAYTELFNLTGHPAISVPAPTSGLPVGLQIAARDEDVLLAIAKAYEEEL
ncbi:amidase [Pyrobaculum aerophilum]|uniref:Glu-tRNA(Gln) amidotransferase subunit A (GatA) n=2 Tax=Pyrobaculum aerophilum TaxID=13773 RepID=Q8ZX10_PYRAE|nr:amidase [Pyrobaculum aerophilum]AAL63539.1 Glu-tRNA(Gln) amidotransferase subunit A (gatA) [Pyrobaculum aerophilum str. IM2]MCX8136007.1 amidase [Pyrobaculum aerophilum]